MKVMCEKLRVGRVLEKLVADNAKALGCQSGMMLPQAGGEESHARQQQQPRREKGCK
jgi:hypothetical protein